MKRDELLILLAGPTNVSREVLTSLAGPIIGHRGESFHTLVSSIQENLRKVFRTQNEVVVLTASGTGAVEASIVTFLRRGEKLVVPVYGVFSERLATIASKHGVDVKRYHVPEGTAPSTDLIEKALDEHQDAAALAVVYNETSTGVTVRTLDRFSKIAKDSGALFMVDAISILGGDILEVDSWGIDVCIAGAQKCLALPPVVSLVSVSEKALARGRRNEPPSTYLNLVSHVDYLRERNETPFTPAIPLFYALDEGLARIVREGLENRYRRHRVCATAFYAAFEEMGVDPLAEKEFRSQVVLSLKYPPGVSDGEFRGRLKEKYGVAVAGGMGALKGRVFRVGCMGEISAQKVIRGVSSISHCLNDLGHKNDTTTALSKAHERLSELSEKPNTA